ncbi:PTS operon transcription antiterminator [Clostridioides difficile]|uniref:Transcription antiterminator n=4 Tax=Clostridioides difficile TaxID=1496 RepID=A0A9R0BMP4_CLODR|nr:PRD domain-containing protein [Clostridioides difficile]OFT99430.1 transcriptional antiterminator [Clostridium sp. HMSC19E03]OFU16737.1 transcriptional antiterminator [Clostridium sp. HMSC19C08]OFU22678.1 transcriptional antiterminator [Clostridium sp. HMSC19C09]OFU26164.1 transcriptional antiterminator [Clostridium sp. HMSC19C05]OFU27648.1 transcriptional antiterminator [Clostridium sp. HMSC19B11]OFU32660.1 transcriptional antiterminator [Clostridium sp. HMSC19B10]OFU46457.1 transcriptio
MNIKKIFNNNVVVSSLEDGTEIIVTGAGVGFKKKVGDLIDENLISKKYFVQDDQRDKYNQILNKTSIEYFKISEEIIEKANEVLNTQVNDSIILALTSHIEFAVQREKQGIKLPNLILNETKQLYREEFKFGLWAIDEIEKRIGIKLPEDEAGYIAIHIINGLENSQKDEGINILEFSKQVIQIIEEVHGFKLDVNSLNYTRLITHLKFFVQRILRKETYNDSDIEDMYKLVNKNYNKPKVCTEEIAALVLDRFEYKISKEEELYLMIHINKITNSGC